MKKEELWKIYCDKNPDFEDISKKNITMSRSGLKKFFDQTWKFAYEDGKNSNEPPENPFGDLFDNFMGGSKKK